jgi:hypothetical protein
MMPPWEEAVFNEPNRAFTGQSPTGTRPLPQSFMTKLTIVTNIRAKWIFDRIFKVLERGSR